MSNLESIITDVDLKICDAGGYYVNGTYYENECDMLSAIKNIKPNSNFITGDQVFDKICNNHDTLYSAICKCYEGRKSSVGVPYINHIFEGVSILYNSGNPLITSMPDQRMEIIEAFMVHDIRNSWGDINKTHATNTSGPVVILDHLSRDSIELAFSFNREILNIQELRVKGENLKIQDISEKIRLMLIADKVQNFKDFIKHHLCNVNLKSRKTKEDNCEMTKYFVNLLLLLGIEIDGDFKRFVEIIDPEFAKLYWA